MSGGSARRAAAIALLPLLLSTSTSCGPTTPYTFLRVKVSFAPGLAIDQLHFHLSDEASILADEVRPAKAGPPLTSGDGVAIVLPDKLAGRTLVVRVTGLSHGADVASGVRAATPSVGMEQEVQVTLVANPTTPPSSISLSPANPSAAAGRPIQLAATGQFMDGPHPVDAFVGWASSAPTIADVDATGKVTTRAPGTARITAGWGSADKSPSGSTTVTVTDPVLDSLYFRTPPDTLGPLKSVQFVAEGLYSNAKDPVDVTAQADWSSTSPAVATVGNAGGSKGRVTAIAPGSTEIRATLSGMTAKSTLTVR